MKNIRKFLFTMLAGSMMLVSGCSDSFKNKLAAGMSIAPYFGASSVLVGTATRTSADKGTRSLITVTVKDVQWKDYEEKQLEMLGCMAAHDFLKKLLPGEAKNEQYIGIDLEDAMNGTKEFEYKVADLLALDEAITISSRFYDVFKSESAAGLAAIIDTASIDNAAILEIAALSANLNKELDANARKMSIKGLNTEEEMETGEIAWQVQLVEDIKGLEHRYLVNVDKKTRKIIGISYNTRKNE